MKLTKITAFRSVSCAVLMCLLVLDLQGIMAASDVTEGTNLFAVNLFKIISKGKPNDNVFVSPLSLQVVLALAYSGARDSTAKEIADILHIPSDNSKMLENYQQLIVSLKAPELKIATNMFVEETFAIKPNFHKNAVSYFSSDAKNVNFRTDKNGARTTINNWVEQNTNNKIKNLLPDGSISEETVLVLVNAIHFLADWKNKFSQYLTVKDKFNVNENQAIDVDMMFMSETLRYGENNALDAKILELPYVNQQFSMYIILPNAINGIANLEEKLGTVDIVKEFNSLTQFKVDVHLPKFKLTETMDLNEVLKTMGIKTMFTESANFQGITDKPIAVSKVIQKAFIDVNEKGTEAAAATGLTVVQLSIQENPMKFNANHPFLFLITKKNGQRRTILFIGKLSKPKQY